MVILSGGTSKGAGDVAARVVDRLERPGVVVHGVALKPGKPICLAVTDGKPVVILPGFPTSAMFTFHEFVAPVIRAFAGLPPERREAVRATLPVRVASERGRTEYVMVSLVETEGGRARRVPDGEGLRRGDGVRAGRRLLLDRTLTETVPAGTAVEVTSIGARRRPADLVVMGSHCVGLDVVIDHLVHEDSR